MKQSEYIDLFTYLKHNKNKKGEKASYSGSKIRNQDYDGTDVAFLTPTCYKQAYYKKDILF